MADQINIKIDASVDPDLTRLLSELQCDVFREAVERFLRGLDTLAQLVSIHVEDGAAGTLDRRVVFKPSDRLLEFVSTMAL